MTFKDNLALLRFARRKVRQRLPVVYVNLTLGEVAFIVLAVAALAGTAVLGWWLR